MGVKRPTAIAICVATAVALTAVASVGASGNLVADGSFETPNAGANYATYANGAKFGPWTVASGSVDQLGTPRWKSADGKQSIDLNGGSPGSIFQAISTVPGAAYTLRFALSGNPESSPSVKTLSVRWAGAEVSKLTFDTTGHTNQAMGWKYHSITVHATSSTTRLEFASLGPSGFYGPAVDDVTLTGAAGEPPPPVAGKSVVADVVSGVVFIQVPQGKSIKRGKGKSSRAYATKFKRYRGKANIPVGSTLDTRKGRVAITSAADLRGGTQSADFYDGIFQIKQARSSHPITDADLVTSRAKCGKSAAHTSASKRLGRLWATGKGKFRTRGRYSAASVRGTTWLTEDRCDGTFTKVSRGRVSVLDKIKHKTVILTAGQSYLARAQRASSK